MKINLQNLNNFSFKRAFTTKEKEKYSKAIEKARQELGLAETSAQIFDFNSPTNKGENYGLSSINSSAFIPFVDFLKENASISKIQMGPQGNLDYKSDGITFKPVVSPYSGTTFTLGIQGIALEKLTQKKYGRLLDKSYIKSLDENYPLSKTTREYKTDYDYALGDNKNGVIFQALKKAYNNFLIRKEETKALRSEFEKFKENTTEEIRKEAIFNAISDEYHSKGKNGDDWKNWDCIDKYLFSNKVSDKNRQKRLDELKSSIDFYLFCQFLAQKQHFETKEELNNKGIKLNGDCLICFSTPEIWANPNCFLEGYYIGVEDGNCPETNNIQTWWAPALDYSKLLLDNSKEPVKSNLGEVGKLLYEKFKTFMQYYDGMRLDAFWQYVSPFIYNDNLEGRYINDIGDKIIKIIQIAAKDAQNREVDPDNFVLELIGYGTDRAKALTKNIYPHMYSTAYAEYDENPRDLINNKKYQDGKFIIGPMSHDNDTLVNMSRNPERRQAHAHILQASLNQGINNLGYNVNKYQTQPQKDKIEEDFRTAKIAEVYTTKKQYFTLTDMFGMEERINLTGKINKDNWKVKIPSDYERFYHSQLSKGYGINFPKVYQVAMIAKGIDDKPTINLLSQAADILRTDGPMTEKEANKLFLEG